MIRLFNHSITQSLNHPISWVPIFCYHRICPEEEIGTDSRSLCVSPAQFERQMFLLKILGYRTISLQDLVSYYQDRKNIHSRSVVLTFDDGYEDNYFYAFPVLRKLKFRATIFLVTDLIGKKNSWDSGKVPLLKESQIEEMHSAGIDFGSHTATHLDLTQTNGNLIKEELLRSKEKLISLTRRLEVSFCYPYARTNETAKKLVEEAGYFCALAGSEGIGEGAEELFSMHRIQIFPSNNLFDFWRKLQSWYPYWMKVQQQKLKSSKT